MCLLNSRQHIISPDNISKTTEEISLNLMVELLLGWGVFIYFRFFHWSAVLSARQIEQVVGSGSSLST